MSVVMNIAGQWQIKQSNGFTVDVSLEQKNDQLTAFCSHSGGKVRSKGASGVVQGDSMILTIPWDNGSRGEYTGRLEKGFFTKVNEGILKGTTKDLDHPSSTASWEVPDRVFLRP
jgi:hypothetical protein